MHFRQAPQMLFKCLALPPCSRDDLPSFPFSGVPLDDSGRPGLRHAAAAAAATRRWRQQARQREESSRRGRNCSRANLLWVRVAQRGGRPAWRGGARVGAGPGARAVVGGGAWCPCTGSGSGSGRGLEAGAWSGGRAWSPGRGGAWRPGSGAGQGSGARGVVGGRGLAPRGAWSGRDRKSTRLNSSHRIASRMPSSA